MSATPSFVRTLSSGGEPVDEPLRLSPETVAGLRVELDALDHARAVALVTGQTYLVR